MAIRSRRLERVHKSAPRRLRRIVVGLAWSQLWLGLLNVGLFLSPGVSVPWTAVVAGMFWVWTLQPGRLGRLRQAARFRLRPVSSGGRWMTWTVAATIGYALAVLIAAPVVGSATSMRSMIFDRLVRHPSAGIQLLLLVVTLGPLLEEIFFRGYIQRTLERGVGAPVAIAITATIFALAHFARPLPLAQIALGIVTGYAAYATRSIWPGVVVHVSYNATVVVSAELGRWGGITLPHSTMLGAAGGWAVAALAGTPLLWLLRRTGQAQRAARQGRARPRPALVTSSTERAAR
ncbi:MAG TPA: type II CAAX endopeptidase family protein [Longimicrobiales bacterium]|nr:type II CAAX endopeptidase family protein [Longimicrobiales bacterium]